MNKHASTLAFMITTRPYAPDKNIKGDSGSP